MVYPIAKKERKSNSLIKELLKAGGGGEIVADFARTGCWHVRAYCEEIYKPVNDGYY